MLRRALQRPLLKREVEIKVFHNNTRFNHRTRGQHQATLLSCSLLSPYSKGSLSSSYVSVPLSTSTLTEGQRSDAAPGYYGYVLVSDLVGIEDKAPQAAASPSRTMYILGAIAGQRTTT